MYTHVYNYACIWTGACKPGATTSTSEGEPFQALEMKFEARCRDRCLVGTSNSLYCDST